MKRPKTLHYKFPCGAAAVVTLYDEFLDIRMEASKGMPHYHVQDTSCGDPRRLDGNELTFGIFTESLPALQKLLTEIKKTLKAKKS